MLRVLRRVSKAFPEGLAHVHHLSNGIEVMFERARGRRPPAFRFRSGTVWHHGPYDNPTLLFRELYVHRLLPSMARAPRGATIVDIGANIGAASLRWAAERPDLALHAYEPNPQAFATLQANVAASRANNVHLYPEAVGREAGRISLWIDVSTVLSTAYGGAPGPNGRKVDAACVTLEQALARTGDNVWLLKIDTEGAEGDILDGASVPALRRCNNIVVEWHDNIVPGVSAIVRARLAGAGFVIQKEHLHPWAEGIIHAVRT
jgi:FkbM family methyltransferase